MKVWLGVIVAGGIAVSDCAACPYCGGEIASTGVPPSSYLGNADSRGNLDLWYSLGTLSLSDRLHIPFYVNFSSNPGNTGLLGKGWKSPLFENLAILISEKVLKVTLLEGREKALYRRANSDSFVSADGFWSARIADSSTIEVLGPGKVVFIYRDGRLHSASFGERVISWIYEGGRLTQIRPNLGRPVVRLVYDGSGSGPVEIDFDGHQFAVTYEKVPIFRNVNGLPLITGFATSMASISDGARMISLHATPGRDGTFTASVLQDAEQNAKKYVWSGTSGLLVSDDTGKYQTTPGEIEGRWKVSRTDSEGKTESFEDVLAYTRQILPDGTEIKRTFLGMRGPAYDRPRSIEISSHNSLISEMRWSYDQNGALIRRIGPDSTEIWMRTETGRLESYSREVAGKTVVKMIYDEGGKVVEKQIGGNLFKYAYLPEGMVVDHFLRGKPVATVIQKAGEAATVTVLRGAEKTKEMLSGLNAGLGEKEKKEVLALVERAKSVSEQMNTVETTKNQ